MKEVRKRGAVPKEETWAVEDLYPSNEACLEAAKRFETMLEKFSSYKGTLDASAQQFYEALEAYSAVGKLFERIYVYANEKLHEDMGNPVQQKLAGETDVLRNRYGAMISWIEPEIVRIPEVILEKFYEDEPRLLKYRIFLQRILQAKAHTLSEREEEMLAKAEELGQAPANIFAMFNNADLTFPEVENEKGEKLPLTQGRYIAYMKSSDRVLRKNAFEALYGAYAKFQNTLGAAYDANARQAAFFAGQRRYQNALEAALDASRIPVSVYDNLIDAVHTHLPAMYRYMELRKKRLDVEKLHMYDIYVPIVEERQATIPFSEAKELVKKGLAPLGEEYGRLLQQGFDSRWIDIYENEGKRTGAYSWGAYGVHPYVLLNYQDDLGGVFTLAHEMGHALHTWYSNSAQPYVYAGYQIFVAEVASTCNEALLIHYLIEQATDRKEKAYLMNYFLEQFRTTLYRQTMFAEFEKKTHEIVQACGSLNGDSLCEIYHELNGLYFGPEVENDREIAFEWSRIPHFYTPFYVYQYATGFSAAVSISSRILKGERGLTERYLEFLKGGCSKDPIELLRGCGVDMTRKEPVDEALRVFEECLNEMETLV